MEWLHQSLTNRINKLSDLDYFKQSKKEINYILESTLQLRCQRTYLINYVIYLQDKAGIICNKQDWNIYVLCFQSIVNTGFKPSLKGEKRKISDSSPEYSDESKGSKLRDRGNHLMNCSVSSINGWGSKNSSFREDYWLFYMKHKDILEWFPYEKVDEKKIIESLSGKDIPNFWVMVQTLFKDYDKIAFINEYKDKNQNKIR